MNRKLLALLVLLVTVLSTFGFAFADDAVTKDADRKPLQAEIKLCRLYYNVGVPATRTQWAPLLFTNDVEGAYGGITWTFRDILSYQAANGAVTTTQDWFPADANIQDDPLTEHVIRTRAVEMLNALVASSPRDNALIGSAFSLGTHEAFKALYMDPDIQNPTSLDNARAKVALKVLVDYWYPLVRNKIPTGTSYFMFLADAQASPTDPLYADLRIKAKQIIENPWLLMDENIVYDPNLKPALTVKQVGNVVLNIANQSGSEIITKGEGMNMAAITYPAGTPTSPTPFTTTYGMNFFSYKYGGAMALNSVTGPKFFDYAASDVGQAFASRYATKAPALGDTMTIYRDPVVVYDVKYATDEVYGDYVSAHTAGHYFEPKIQPGISGNMNRNYDASPKVSPYYVQAAWAHEHQKLSEIHAFLIDIMENNFQDHNTMLLNTFHGEYASQYQMVYINAPASTPILENTLTLNAVSKTDGVTLAVNGSTIIATYGAISASNIEFELSAKDRNMEVLFTATDACMTANTALVKAADKDLRLYADYPRWDDEDMNTPCVTYSNAAKLKVVEGKATGYDQYHITGLVTYGGVNYVVTQPVTFAQNPTAAANVGFGKPKDLRINGSDKMNIIVDPTGATWNGKVTYESLTPNLITVDANGVVTAKGIATTSTIKAYVLVTVTDNAGANIYYTNGDNDKIDTTKPYDLSKQMKIEITISDKALTYMKNAVIVGTAAPIYKKADATSDYYGIIDVGTIIDYTSDTKVVNGFLEVIHHGAPAYIKMANVSFETATPAATTTTETPAATSIQMKVATKNGALNQRNAANGTVIGSLAKGTVVTVVDTTNAAWYKLSDGSFVSASYLVAVQ